MVRRGNHHSVGAAPVITPVVLGIAVASDLETRHAHVLSVLARTNEMSMQPLDRIQLAGCHRSCLDAIERRKLIGGGHRADGGHQRDDSG